MRNNISPPLSFAKGLGTYERAILALLTALSRDMRYLPTLDELASLAKTDPNEFHRLFRDSDAVLVALTERALMRLLDGCTKAVVKVNPNDALCQFLAVGEAFLDWTTAHKVQFRLIVEPGLLDLRQHPQLRRYLTSIRAVLLRMLERARNAGDLRPDEDTALLLLTSGTFAYGLARMIIDERFPPDLSGPDATLTARHALRDFLARLDPARRQTAKACKDASDTEPETATL